MVRDEEQLVDKAARYVEKRQLITSVGVPAEWRDKLTNHEAEMLLVYSESLNDIAEWVFSDLLCWTEEKVAAKLSGVRSGRDFWEQRDKAWADLNQRSKRGLAQATLYNMKATASAWPWARRIHTDIIGFEHHRLLVGMEQDQQDYWMELAQEGGWSSTQLRIRIYDLDPLTPKGTQDVVQEEDDVVRFCLEAGLHIQRLNHARIELEIGGRRLMVEATRRSGKPVVSIRMEE